MVEAGDGSGVARSFDPVHYRLYAEDRHEHSK